MYIFDYDEVVILPLDFNLFHQSAYEYKTRIRFSRDYSITEKMFEEIVILLQDTCESKYFAVDMNAIVSYPSRKFSELTKYNFKKLFFFIMFATKHYVIGLMKT